MSEREFERLVERTRVKFGLIQDFLIEVTAKKLCLKFETKHEEKPQEMEVERGGSKSEKVEEEGDEEEENELKINSIKSAERSWKKILTNVQRIYKQEKQPYFKIAEHFLKTFEQQKTIIDNKLEKEIVSEHIHQIVEKTF